MNRDAGVVLIAILFATLLPDRPLAFSALPASRRKISRNRQCQRPNRPRELLLVSLEGVPNSKDRLDGLLSDSTFERYESLDELLESLSGQIPWILLDPLTKKDVGRVYSPEFSLIGPRGEELASDSNELVSLSTTLSVTAAAALQTSNVLASSFGATSLSSLAVAGSSSPDTSSSSSSSLSSSSGSDTNTVRSDFILDLSSLDRMLIRWETTPETALMVRTQRIQGLSELTMEQNDKGQMRVVQHRLLSLTIDGQSFDEVGERLATLRRAVRSVQESPIIQSITGAAASSLPLLAGIRDELLLQARPKPGPDAKAPKQTVTGVDGDGGPASFVRMLGTTDLDAVKQNETSTARTGTERIKTPNTDADSNDGSGVATNLTELLPLESLLKSGLPVPGTSKWKQYSSAHAVLRTFVTDSLPTLLSTSSKATLFELFSEDCCIVTKDGTKLMDGGDSVADLYRYLASIRQGTLQTLDIDRTLANWKEKTIELSWTVVGQSPVRLRGKDVFTINDVGLIEQIQQTDLVIGGNTVDDPEVLKRLIRAVQNGGNTAGAERAMDVIQQFTTILGRGGDRGSPLTAQQNQKQEGTRPQRLSDEAAVAVYRIAYLLHQDLLSLDEPLANDFLAPTVQLKGYFDEVLANGDAAYRQAARVALASLRGTISTGRVVWKEDKPTERTVKFLADGVTLELDTILNLKIPVTPQALLLLSPGTADAPTIPLKIQIVSQYRVNRTGKIVEHVLLETRVNDRLTPGDVVSRFLRGKPFGDGSNAVQQFMDLVVRSSGATPPGPSTGTTNKKTDNNR